MTNLKINLLTGLILIFGLLTGISAAAEGLNDGADAAALPSLPCELSGSVMIGDIPAPAGTIITAYVGGEETGRFVINQAGTYGGDGLFDDRLIIENDGTTANNEVTFRIWSNDVSETIVYKPGESQTFNLKVAEIDGDFNRNALVDIGDVSKVAYMIAGKAQTEISADFNGNDEVDIGDAAKIAHFFVRKIEFL